MLKRKTGMICCRHCIVQRHIFVINLGYVEAIYLSTISKRSMTVLLLIYSRRVAVLFLKFNNGTKVLDEKKEKITAGVDILKQKTFLSVCQCFIEL